MSMKKLFDAADVYLRQFTWKDLALVKFCLFSMGLFCGLFVKDKNKKHFAIGTLIVFVATYIPLMSDFIPMLKKEFAKSQDEEITFIEE